MELRERIARAVSQYLCFEFAEWDVADPLARKEALALAVKCLTNRGRGRRLDPMRSGLTTAPTGSRRRGCDE